MHLSFVLKKVIEYIYIRRVNFLLTLIVLIASLYVAAYALQTRAEADYYIYAAKKRLTTTNILNVQMIPNPMGDSSEEAERFEQFDAMLKERYRDRYGKFMHFEVNYLDDGKKIRIKTLYIDDSLLNLCDAGMDLSGLTEPPPEGTLTCYVGSDLAEQYKPGTLLTTEHIGTELYVKGALPEGAGWIPSMLLYTDHGEEILDNGIVTVMDENYFDTHIEFYGNTYSSLYFFYDTKEESDEMKLEIRELAEEQNLMCYLYTFDDMVATLKEERINVHRAINVLVIFALAVAGLSSLSAGLADVYSRHYELAVMYVNKVSSLDMLAMLLIENMIRMVIATGMAAFFFSRGLDALHARIYMEMVLPGLAFGMLIFMLAMTGIEFMTINRRKLLALIGGAKL